MLIINFEGLTIKISFYKKGIKQYGLFIVNVGVLEWDVFFLEWYSVQTLTYTLMLYFSIFNQTPLLYNLLNCIL